MKRTTVAYVDSSRDRTKRHIIIKRGSRFECTCMDFFFKDNRDNPCRHIRQLFKSNVEEDGTITHLKAVQLTPKGEKILKDRHQRKEREAAQVAAREVAAPPRSLIA